MESKLLTKPSESEITKILFGKTYIQFGIIHIIIIVNVEVASF